MSSDVMEKIEAAATKGIALKERIGAMAGNALLKAELATVKANNDMQDAKEQRKTTELLASITERLTSLLKMPEDECRKELEAIYKELDGVEQEIAKNVSGEHVPDNSGQIELVHYTEADSQQYGAGNMNQHRYDIKQGFAEEDNRGNPMIADMPFADGVYDGR